MQNITAKTFLSRVWPSRLFTHETLELRIINRKTNEIHREFTTSPEEFLEKAQKYKHCEIYFGVATRFGKGGKKHDCYRLCTVWADLDGKTLKDIVNLKPVPSMVVESGSGLHLYWVLKSPLLIRDGNGRVTDIEAINRALCEKFGGDITTIDVSRILRVPNYLNHKYNPPRRVKAYEL